MKTNVVMLSQDRNLFGSIIRQQTKNGMLNLSDLQQAYEKERLKHGWPEKHIYRIMESDKESLFYLLEHQGVVKLPMCSFTEAIDSQGFAKYMKSLGVYKTTGVASTKTTWVNPYIWLMVAMELNPKFKAKTVIWLTDSLIFNRVEAGDFCKELNAAIQKFNPTLTQYIKLAQALNYVAFGKHEAGIRNTGTQAQLKLLARIEIEMAYGIKINHITSFEMLLEELRELYRKLYIKHQTKKLN